MTIKEELISKSDSDKLLSDFSNGFDDFFFWTHKYSKDNEEVFYSENVVNVTGFTAEQIRNFPGRGNALIHNDDSQKIKKSYSDFINNSELTTLTLEYRTIKSDESIMWIRESLKAERDSSGRPTKLTGVVFDISVTKKEELQLSDQLEVLKQTNSSKDKFISMLSHDLRAPFTSILGFSEILMNEPNLSFNERLEYLSYINDSSQNQLQLINYLLDWSRLQTGRIKIEPQRLQAQTIIFNCVSSLTGNAIRKKIEIKVDALENLFVQADERLLTQVITNLISNAIKFSPEDSVIQVFAEVFNDDFVEFIVKDYGKGISEENKTKMFRIEKMFSTEGTKGEKGTGLGLSLVKEIVEKHDGDIWFYSEVDKGSEFHFTIPRSPNTILLVEDSESDRLYYQRIIKDNFPNYQVISAANGYEAISIILKKLPSIVLTDHEMPMMNGVQLIEAIRKEDPNLRIPIIVVAAQISRELRTSYLSFGIKDILLKPVDSRLFVDKVKLALE